MSGGCELCWPGPGPEGRDPARRSASLYIRHGQTGMTTHWNSSVQIFLNLEIVSFFLHVVSVPRGIVYIECERYLVAERGPVRDEVGQGQPGAHHLPHTLQPGGPFTG